MQHFFGQIKTKVFSSDILAQNKTQRGRAELFWTDFKSVLFGYSFTNFLEKCYFLYSSKKKKLRSCKIFWTDNNKSVLFGYNSANKNSERSRNIFLMNENKNEKGRQHFFGPIRAKVFFFYIIGQTKTKKGHATFFLTDNSKSVLFGYKCAKRKTQKGRATFFWTDNSKSVLFGCN